MKITRAPALLHRWTGPVRRARDGRETPGTDNSARRPGVCKSFAGAAGAVAIVALGALVSPLTLQAPSAGAAAPEPQSWKMDPGPTKKMTAPRSEATATVLSGPGCDLGPQDRRRPDYCGKVLVAGGYSFSPAGARPLEASTELYDPAADTWTSCTQTGQQPGSSCPGNLKEARYGAKAVQLADGKVLVVGGRDENGELASTELYDPSRGIWTSCSGPGQAPGPNCPGSMALMRYTHTATLLTGTKCASNCGKVLVAGGFFTPTGPTNPEQGTDAAELYDPATGLWSSTPPLSYVANRHTATVLSGPNCGSNCDKVLLAGGRDHTVETTPPQAASLFDPATATWSPTGPLGHPRFAHDAVLLEDGKVLIAGGLEMLFRPEPPTTTEIYDPITGTWSPGPPMNQGRDSGNYLAPLPGGRIVVAGSANAFNSSSDKATQIYSARAPGDGWQSAASLNVQRQAGSLVALGCDASAGRVMIAGGYDSTSGDSLNTYELFDRVPTVDVKTASGLSGPVTGGAVVTIKGMGFKPLYLDSQGTVAVTFGETPAAGVTKVSDDEITAVAPPRNAAGKVDVAVTVDGVAADTCGQDLQFDYTPALAVAAVDPPLGPVTGGTRVKITGKSFSAETTVKFGETPATEVAVNSSGDTLTATTPAHDPGPVTVTVSTAVETATAAFAYHPVISALTPPSGPTKGGTAVNIAGKGLAGTTSVTFGGIEAEFSDVSDESVMAEAPPHPPGQVQVAIETSEGAAIPLSLTADRFSYEDSAFAAIDPPQGEPVAGATSGGKVGSQQPPGLPAGTGAGTPFGSPVAQAVTAPGPASLGQIAQVSAPGLISAPVQAPAAAGMPPPAAASALHPGQAAYLEPGREPLAEAVTYAMVGLDKRDASPLAALAVSAGVVALGTLPYLATCSHRRRRLDEAQHLEPAAVLAY